MLANLKSWSALVVLVCIAVGSTTGGASAATLGIARKCEDLTIKAYPPREPGNPAAGSAMGTGPEERSYYTKCVANGGNVGTDHGTPPRATGENGMQVGALVHFPSGGPTMTITGIQGDKVICEWKTEAGQIVSGTFPATALTAVGGSGDLRARQEEHYIYKPCPNSVAINGRNVCI